jgi:hypothetical protein
MLSPHKFINPERTIITIPSTHPVYRRIHGMIRFAGVKAVAARLRMLPRIEPSFIFEKVRRVHDLYKCFGSSKNEASSLSSKGGRV